MKDIDRISGDVLDLSLRLHRKSKLRGLTLGVIPAKAGISFFFPKAKGDPGFRRDDE